MNFETRESPIESQAGDTNKLQPQKMQVEESQARGSYATVSQPLKYRSVKGTKRGKYHCKYSFSYTMYKSYHVCKVSYLFKVVKGYVCN